MSIPNNPEQIRQRLAPLLAARGVELGVLFGSMTHGRARSTSDIDLGVITTGDRAALTADLIEALGTDRVDVVDLAHASPLLTMVVAREGIPLHEARPGAFAEFASLALRRYNDTAKLRRLQEQSLRRYAESQGLD